MTRVADRIQRRMGLGTRVGPAAARHEVGRFVRRLAVLIAALTALLIAGGSALATFEGTSYWYGLIWAFDTVATIGSIAHPETLGGQITKLVLVTLGLGTMLYVLVTLTELFVTGDFSGLLEARRMQRKISDLKDHYLICGFGRVGRQVARDLADAGVPFVVVDDNPDVRDAYLEDDVLYIEGRASHDEVLLEAGILNARAVIACVDSDAENIFATLTARQLRPDIQIVARAAEETSEPKLVAAGATEVVSPYKTSGRAMAKLALGDREAVTAADGDGSAPQGAPGSPPAPVSPR